MNAPAVQELLQKSAAWLQERGIDAARRECEWIFSAILGLSRLELYTRFDMPVAGPELERLRSALRRRAAREPLAYILGTQPFRGLELIVTPAVLVPRPETEELVDLVLAASVTAGATAALRVHDVGTGSGALALALAHERPQWRVSASDLSREALAVARQNAAAAGLEVDFIEADLLTGIEGSFDLLVANLPYVAESERSLCDPELAYEPQQALFAAQDGLALIRRLIEQAGPALAPEGQLWLEHGFRQAERIAELATSHGFTATTHLDLAGHRRFSCLQTTP